MLVSPFTDQFAQDSPHWKSLIIHFRIFLSRLLTIAVIPIVLAVLVLLTLIPNQIIYPILMATIAYSAYLTIETKRKFDRWRETQIRIIEAEAMIRRFMDEMQYDRMQDRPRFRELRDLYYKGPGSMYFRGDIIRESDSLNSLNSRLERTEALIAMLIQRIKELEDLSQKKSDEAS